jgi:hypothetical protein
MLNRAYSPLGDLTVELMLRWPAVLLEVREP